MTRSLASVLQEVAQQLTRRGYALQPPCPEQALETLRANLRRRFRLEMPRSYDDMLRMMNGLDFNGTVIYAAVNTPNANLPREFLEGVLEANERLALGGRAANFMVLGESGMEMYACNLASGRWDVVDQVAEDVYETYATVDELLIAALAKRLPRSDAAELS